MRTIKFRGKSIESNQWVFGNFIQTENGQCYIFNYHFIPAISCPAEKFIEVDPKTIGQFIGLQDKNGVDLYTDDIVGEWYPYDEPGWEYFKITFGRMIDCRYGYFPEGYGAACTVDVFSKLEKKGNIHDNPELACLS
jgi:hypothetical protein